MSVTGEGEKEEGGWEASGTALTSTSGTEHPGKVEGQTKRGGDEGSEERRVRPRVSETAAAPPPASRSSGPPAAAEAERRPRAARSSGGKDRHSKVNTAKGPRDRRVRLSVPTAVQFYDVQDRLGYDQPSKAVEWLIKHAKAAIDELAQLPPVRQGEPAAAAPPEQPQPPPPPQQQQQPQTISASTFSGGLSGVLPTPSLIESSYRTYESHGQAFVPGMEPLDHGHGGPYGQVPVDPNELFRDVAGSSSGRTESRAKARERARERAKEKQHTETGYAATPSPSPLPAPPQYANLQVSSALQHPFQAPRQAPPPYHQSSYFPEAAFSSPPFGGYPTGSYEPSFSQYFVDNPPTPAAARYPTQVPNPSFSPGPSRFAGLLSDPGFGYISSPYPNPPPQRPRLPVFPQPSSSHVVVRPPPPATPQQQQQQQQHTLDPNFYYPQMPSFEELEEEFKP